MNENKDRLLGNNYTFFCKSASIKTVSSEAFSKIDKRRNGRNFLTPGQNKNYVRTPFREYRKTGRKRIRTTKKSQKIKNNTSTQICLLPKIHFCCFSKHSFALRIFIETKM
jgi:hypothetical protein